MPEAMRFEEYNWVAIRKFFRKSGSRKATCERFKMTTYMFDKAVRLGEIKPAFVYTWPEHSWLLAGTVTVLIGLVIPPIGRQLSGLYRRGTRKLREQRKPTPPPS